jgi:hypothetical protein
MEQLESAIRAVDVQLDDKALAKLDEIFPGYKDLPGGLRLVVHVGTTVLWQPSPVTAPSQCQYLRE